MGAFTIAAASATSPHAVTFKTTTFTLTKGDDGTEIELQKTATHVQWRYVGGAWVDLVALADIKGDRGDDGDDGLEVELQKTATHIQWRLTGGTWADLVALADLKGDAGASATPEYGESRRFPGGSAPTGWQLQGLVLSQAAYPATFAKVGLLHDWATWATTGQATAQVNRMAFGGGRFMCAQVTGGVLYSTDNGATWAQGVVNVGSTAWGGLDALAYSPTLGTGTGRWITAGNTGYAWYSDDGGATWTSVVDPGFTASRIRGACWTGTNFVIVGDAGKTAYSADGLTWTLVTVGSSQWDSCASDGSRLIIGSGTVNAQYSDNHGVSYTAYAIVSHFLYDLVWCAGMGLFIGGGSTYAITYTDGKGSWAWKPCNRSSPLITRLATDGNEAIMQDKNGGCYRLRSDLSLVTLPFQAAQGNNGGIAYGGGQWVIGNGAAATFHILRAGFSYNTATDFRLPSTEIDAGVFSDTYFYTGV